MEYVRADFYATNRKGKESNRLTATVAVLRNSLQVNVSIMAETSTNITWQILGSRPMRCQYTFARFGDVGNFTAMPPFVFQTNITQTITTPANMNKAFFRARCTDQYGYTESALYRFNVEYYTDYFFNLVNSIVFWVFMAFIVLPIFLIYYLNKRRSRGET